MTALSTIAMLAIMSGITVALILLFKKLAGRRLSPFFHYYIWLLLVIRLVFPILPQSQLSVFNIFDNFASVSFDIIGGSKSVLPDTVSSDSGDGSGGTSGDTASPLASADDKSGDKSSANNYGVIDGIESVEADVESVPLVTENVLVFAVWGAVTLVVLAGGLVKYNIQRRAVLRRVLPCYDIDVLREAEFILASYKIKRHVDIFWGDSSMLLGVLNPAVIIDKACRRGRNHSGETNKQFELVLAHELTHLHRRDNLKNFIYGIFSCLYWFNPLVWYAFSQMRNDAELLCDHTALTRFGLCSSKYAELLYSSVNENPTPGSAPSAAPAMSKAGRQLIRRLNFISARRRRASITMRLVSILVITAIAALCLTNPIAAVKAANYDGNYLIKYRELLSDTSLAFPESNSNLTVRGFITATLLALDSAELPLDVRSRLQTMRSVGTDYLLEEVIKDAYSSLAPERYTNFIKSIEPDEIINREQAAFLLNSLLLLIERDSLIIPDTLPTIITQNDYEDTLSQLSTAAKRKFSAFFTLKSVYNTSDEGNREYKTDESSQSLIKNSPLCVILPYYSFDPYASRRERNMLLGYLNTDTDFYAYQLLASVTDNTEYDNFIATVPSLLPQVLPADSYNNNLIGTITDPALKSEIEALYKPYTDPSYPDMAIYVLAVQPDKETADSLTLRLLENSTYTYAKMVYDQAICGYDYISSSRSILPMSDYSFTRDDGSEVVYSILGKKEYEYLYSLASPDEQRILRAYFILKDPDDTTLDAAYREKIAQTFRIDTAVYIFDPEATQNERAEVETLIAKYATDYTSVYALPVCEYTAYRDEAEIDPSAVTAIRCLQSYGVFDADTEFNPKDEVTFADAAEMIVRLYSVLLIY